MNSSPRHRLSMAYSPCPNDTYIFHALAEGRIATGGIDLEITLADVETLNREAASGSYDVTKLSFSAMGHLLDEYALLRSGSALGRGCGPLVISLPESSMARDVKPVVAVPGLGTTAFLLFRFFMAHCYPGIDPVIKAMPFEQVMPAVRRKEADFGVIIHEGRFVYQNYGLESLADLGQWWEDQTGLPIPLGCIAIKRSLGAAVAKDIDRLIRGSLAFAEIHPEAGRHYIKSHAQELDDAVIDEHIHLYVNDFSRDIGKEGEEAVKAFFERGKNAGLVPETRHPLFAY